ncbi:MAG: UDP-N-acetylglucosamine 1-carboxyvinyltransferase [Ruminococcaceae bacterium]|nr:UDP-N-acetylglucosamine 1-carboxyvinyltransferase [Oscillospiraceae bacterium]
MQYIQISGKKQLGGEIALHGAKNSVLPILAGTVLIDGTSTLHNCPDLSDVAACCDIIRHLGGSVSRTDDVIFADTTAITQCEIPKGLMEEMRSSIIFLGSLSARCGKACMYLPGGCKIGARPIDIHIKSLRTLGYHISFDGSNICCEKANAKGGSVTLPFPSVGATENVILASVLLGGVTTIINAAREPEITDLADYLNSAGAKISGAGSSVIRIEGVARLQSAEHTVIPDRILASTFMSAVAAAGGDIVLKKVNISHLSPILPVFEEMGCKFFAGHGELKIKSPHRIKSVKRITTGVYPSFPTDSQAPVMASLCTAKGSSVITETIFENRLQHAGQLSRFGADIVVSDRTAFVTGVKNLHGAAAYCTDLRGGAAIIIAALAAEGDSQIYKIHHIDRGYENIERQLSLLGADIRRKYDEKEQ